jgi:hypothetical protein
MKLRAARRLAALSPRRRLLVSASLLLVAVLLVLGALRAVQSGDPPAARDPGTSRPAESHPRASSAGAGSPGTSRPGRSQHVAVVLVPGYGGNTPTLRSRRGRRSGGLPGRLQQLVPGSSLLTGLARIPFTGRPAWLSLWTSATATS